MRRIANIKRRAFEERLNDSVSKTGGGHVSVDPHRVNDRFIYRIGEKQVGDWGHQIGVIR